MEPISEQKSESILKPKLEELRPPPTLFTNTNKPGDKAEKLKLFYTSAKLFLNHLNNSDAKTITITLQNHQVEESLLALIERVSTTKSWLDFYGNSIKSRFQIYDYILYVKNKIDDALKTRKPHSDVIQLNMDRIYNNGKGKEYIFNKPEYLTYITAMKELIEKNNQLYIDSKQNPVQSGGKHHPYKKSYHRPTKHRKRTLRHKTHRSSKRRIIK